MAMRAYWKGHVRLALVTFPVRLYAAVTSTERISLNRIHRETGERVRMQNHVPGIGPVDSDDVVMGYEYDRGRYVPIEDEELESLEVESKHTIDLNRFVDLSAIDPVYYDRPYFLAPDGAIANEAFVTIRDALREAGKVALGQVVLSRRERIVAIRPRGKGLLLQTLRWADEVREPDAFFADIEEVSVSAEQIEMAQQLITARAGPFEPETFVDRHQEALRALINEKLEGEAGEAAAQAKAETPSNVVNLMDALKASLQDGENGRADRGGRKTGKAATAGKGTAGRKAAKDKAPKGQGADEGRGGKTRSGKARQKKSA